MKRKMRQQWKCAFVFTASDGRRRAAPRSLGNQRETVRPTPALAGPLVRNLLVRGRGGWEGMWGGVGLAEVCACGCVVMRSPWRSLLFSSSERSSHKMMGKVALLGLAFPCGLGGAAAQVSTADLCAHLCCSFGVGRGRGRGLDGAGRGRSGRLRHVATSQRNVTARPCVRAHQECAKCSADLDINGIVGVDDLPLLDDAESAYASCVELADARSRICTGFATAATPIDVLGCDLLAPTLGPTFVMPSSRAIQAIRHEPVSGTFSTKW